METQSYIAGEVRAELARQGRNQAWLAEQLGQNEVWVSRRLKGRVPIAAADLATIADLLSVPITVFLPTKRDGVAS